ncbi:N-6 DNA methylase [Ralstonia nicotianae]
MDMKDNTIWRLLDHLRGALDPAAALELVLQILVWEKWSREGRLPDICRLTRKARSAHYVEDWYRLRGEEDLRLAFPDDRNISRLGDAGFQSLVELVLQLADAGVLRELDAADGITVLSPFEGELAQPPAVADFLTALGMLRPGQSVYAPWDWGAQLAVRATRQDCSVYVETPSPSPLPLLVSLLAGGTITVRQGNPITSPTAIEKGKSGRFDVAVAFPPLNYRYDAEVAERDWYQRFPEKTTSGNVLAIRHLLAQASQRVIVAVAPGLLFARGAEAALREDLLARGMIEAVVAMPPGVLLGTNIAFAVLILDPLGGHRSVRFVNADSDRFKEVVSKGRARLTNVAALSNLALTDTKDPDAVVVATAEILENGAQLQVGRYIVPDVQRQLQAKLAAAKTVALGQLVTMLRPLSAKTGDSDTVGVWEVGPGDLPSYGYIDDAPRSVRLSRGLLLQKGKQQFLRPYDIVLFIRGVVGKVGIVPPEVPSPGEGGWVAGQSAMVLRVDDAAGTDPRALFLQLRSPLGQALLQSIVSGGATMQMINLSELKALGVLLPSVEEQTRIAEVLKEESEIQHDIDRLRKQQARVSAQLWQLD